MRTGKPRGYGTDEPHVRSAGEIGSFFRGTEMEGKITPEIADITDSAFYPVVVLALDGRKADLAFIDASHDYESIKVVFERLVLPRMQEGGLVIFDDYMRAATHPA